MLHHLAAIPDSPGDDIFTDILQRDWAAAGGRYRRLEASAERTSLANDELRKQNGQLITANEITKHFFEETTPKRGESHNA